MKERFEEIAIVDIDEDVPNHRLVKDGGADADLVESIHQNGVQEPIKVNAKADGRFTLVFGFRRVAAARFAGLTTIPAMVAEGLTDNEIRTLQAVENIDRKDLHPLEEAEICNELADNYSPTESREDDAADFVAAQLGRSVKWVENRLMLARLSERVKQVFLDGDITLGHAQLIGRLASHEAQEEVLGLVKAQIPSWHSKLAENKEPAKTIAETRSHVERRLRDLKFAEWKLDLAFDGKPACENCPHNSANRLELFDNDQPKQPVCLNAECFGEKSKFTKRAIVRATNTLMKNAPEKLTPAQAKKAITEREVEFVKPKEVVEAAKRRADTTAPTAAEKKGSAQQDRKSKIDQRFRELEDKWEDPVIKAIENSPLRKNPHAVAMMWIIREAKLLDSFDRFAFHGPTAKPADRKKLKTALKIAKDHIDDGTEDEGVDQLITFLKTEIPKVAKSVAFEHPLYLDPPGAEGLEIIADALGIEHEPRPTREQVEKELFPEEAKKKTAKKKRSKKKAAGKKKATS